MESSVTKTFCSEYIHLSSGTEIPETFTAWCSLSATSAVLARRLWIDMGPFNIYPNMYLVLVAGSGRLRKSTAINVARDMLQALEHPPNFMSQKMTTEAVITDLIGGQVTDGKSTAGQGFLITDELTNFLNAKSTDGGIGSLLIDLYDCKDFSYSTKSRGKEKIKDSQLGLLAATTPHELRRAVPPEAIGSGLASRILFIYEDRETKPVAFPVYTDRQRQAREFCINALSRFQLLPPGPIKLGQPALEWGKECYEQRCHASKLFLDPFLSGYASRRFVHIFKIAISLCVGLTESLNITPNILERAEALVLSNESHLQRVIQLVTTNDKGQEIAYINSLVEKAGRITRSQLLALTSHRIDSRELTEIVDTLIHSGQLAVEHDGKQIYYYTRKD